MTPLLTHPAPADSDPCADAMQRCYGSTRVWDQTFLRFVNRLDGDATAGDLVACIPFACLYATPVDRWSDMEWGETVRDRIGDVPSLFRRIATHPAADASVWIALQRARDPDANAALLVAERPHQDSAYRRAALRFPRLLEQLLLRLAKHASGPEFQRVARYAARRVARMESPYGGVPAARFLSEEFERLCAERSAGLSDADWPALLHAARDAARLRGLALASTGRPETRLPADS
jgi:hypothetical protein